MKRHQIILGTFVALATASCSSTAGSSNAAAFPPLGRIPIVTSPEQIKRPIDGYLATPKQIATIHQAAEKISAQCMANFGLPPSRTMLQGFDDAALRANITHSHVYGFFDPANVTAKGYDVIVVRQIASDSRQSGGASDAETNSVLSGVDSAGNPVASFHGEPLPVHGCMGEGSEKTGGALPLPIADSLPDGGPRIPSNDPRLIDIDKKWSGCMKGKGYNYATPWDAMEDPRWSNKEAFTAKVPSGDQIATAEADLACKKSTNFMGIAIAIEFAYDDQYIKSHATQLADYAQKLSGRLKISAKVIAGNG